ncbi:isoprenylcysteine carboxylmethyltransferase family protein [Parapedobacter sp. ISTM3]|uniref:methyltransferase family protein n=1 Tax=Parapedobacter sp. ISTM3 TaxID=2800130 RepID=UPI001F2A7F3B|nr:isoprenylcysteine carboxylmethyltransferase family protein [Parapedobacter sp. ISTM3]
MKRLGNVFFRYRNFVFIFLYLMLFLPSPELFREEFFGRWHELISLVLGLSVTLFGQLIRGLTIGLVYIIRGGKDRTVYAEGLVTDGVFSHVRNPLYLGNILMLAGVGILANSMVFMAFVVPLFLFIYQCIVLAEEDFLRKKFGSGFEAYTSTVSRWFPKLGGFSRTFASMPFNWRRWLVKEYNTQFIWLCGMAAVILIKYPAITGFDDRIRFTSGAVALTVFSVYYLVVRYMKKSGKWKAKVG